MTPADKKTEVQLNAIWGAMYGMYPTEIVAVFHYLHKYPAIVCDSDEFATIIDKLYKGLGILP